MKSNFYAMLSVAIFAPVVLSGCSDAGLTATAKGDTTYTLYHNNKTAPGSSERTHWATFDSGQPGNHNFQNCSYTAELLNYALEEHFDGDTQGVRFWCERGPYQP